MPLSPPVGRQHLHTRRVVCQGFFRDDGLWDIEGRITDGTNRCDKAARDDDAEQCDI